MKTSGPKLGSTAPTEKPDSITHICNPSTPMEEMEAETEESPEALRPRWPFACKRCCLEQDKGEDEPLTCTTHCGMNSPSITHEHTEER